MDTATYQVNPARLDTLRATLDKMNRRAAKLAITGVSYTIGALQTRIVTLNPNIADDAPGQRTKVEAWHDVTLSIEPIKLAGWTFIATLDHTSEAGVILRGVPGEVIPVTYRDAKPTCDHCGFTRTRKETFVVRHDDGTHKQVGRQCVRDFLGVDPTHAARMAEFAIAMGEAMEAAGESGGGGLRYTALAEYMYAVSVSMRLDGWLSRKAARDMPHRTATATAAFMILYPGRPDMRSAAEKDAQRVTDADIARADLAIEWARGLRNGSERELNDYEHNLTVVAAGEIVTDKTAGIAASMLPGYLRAAGQEVERRKAAAESHHVGTIGKREIFAGLTVSHLHEMQGEYGVTTICTFIDPTGNRIKWFASKAVDFAIGDVLTIKATVKAHGEWKSIKETTVSRAAIVAVPVPTQDAEGWGGEIPTV